MTEREVESRCAECGSRNRIRMLPRDPATDVPGVLCLECSDFVPDQARADIRAEVLAEVVARLEGLHEYFLKYGTSGVSAGAVGEAIATVREMGEK